MATITDRQISRQKTCQKLSVMKANNSVFVVLKTKHDLNLFKLPILWKQVSIAEIL
jgi:hypothetical protein